MHRKSIGISAVVYLALLYGTSALPADVISNGNIRHEDNIAEESNPPNAGEIHRVPAPSELTAGPHFAVAIIQPPPLHVTQSAADDETKSESEEIQPPAVVVLIAGRDDKEGATPDKDERTIASLSADVAGKSLVNIRQPSDLGLTINEGGGSTGTIAAGAGGPGKSVSGSTTVLEGADAAAAKEEAQKAVQEALGGIKKGNTADLISSALKDLKKRGQAVREADEDKDKGSAEKESGEEEKPEIPLLPFVPGGPPPEVEKPDGEEETEEEEDEDEEQPAKPSVVGEKPKPGTGGLVVPPGSGAGLVAGEGVNPQPGVSPPLVPGQGLRPGVIPRPGTPGPPQVPPAIGQGELPQLQSGAGNVEIPIMPPVTRPDLSDNGNVNIPQPPSVDMEGLRPELEQPNFVPGAPGGELVQPGGQPISGGGEVPPIGVPQQPLQSGIMPPQQPAQSEIFPQQPIFPQIPPEQLPINPEIPPERPIFPQGSPEQLPLDLEVPPQQPTFPQVPNQPQLIDTEITPQQPTFSQVPIQQQPQVIQPEQPIQVIPEQPGGLAPPLQFQPFPSQDIPQQPINPEIPPQQPTFPQVPIQQQPQFIEPEQPIQVIPEQPGGLPPPLQFQPVPSQDIPQQPINPEIPPLQPTFPQVPIQQQPQFIEPEQPGGLPPPLQLEPVSSQGIPQQPINPEIPPLQPTFPQVPIQQQPQFIEPEQPIEVIPEQPGGLPPPLQLEPVPSQGIPQQPMYTGAVGVPTADGISPVPQGVPISEPFQPQALGGQPPPFAQGPVGPLAQSGTPGQLITGLPSSVVQPGGEQVIPLGFYPGIGSSRPVWTPAQYLEESFGAIREVPNFRLIPVKAVRFVGNRPRHDVKAKGKRNYRADPILATRTRDAVAYRGYPIPRYFAIVPTY